ncbi:sugar transferase [Thioclava sp. FTW29]|uniref:Sugar transferase n=1 Tax=Thioclava litoralis TaxID=3076557 RepID=A0ABZ1E2D9_9RHOB|nr:sugar transferase [Thioclava sp. FTW29]
MLHSASLSKSLQNRASAQISTRRIYHRRIKPLFDLLLALAFVPLLAPVIGVLWGLARLDGGPGFYGHRRIGRNGKVFRCWKIRTMVPDAERRLALYLATNADAAVEWQLSRKLSDDPRVTRLGRFLRKTSLDELPQLWNVLRGEMSFVGPRPVTEDELALYHHRRDAYLCLRPGITGFWQILGRSDLPYSLRVEMDAAYVQKSSLFMDIGLILLTAATVLRGTGQ